MVVRKNYENEALKLAKACDIAIEIFGKFPPKNWDKKTVLHVQNCYREWKDKALTPQPKFKNLASLKYKTDDVFTIFLEESGDFVEYFWKEIKNQNLDYVRKDILGKILKRGKIKSMMEFDYVTDVMVLAIQENRITNVEFKLLNEMLGNFERKKRK